MTDPMRELIQQAVERSGSQAQLATALQQSPATISRWKAGLQQPDVGSCLKLAKLIGLPPQEVLSKAGYDPRDYLPESGITLSSAAEDIASRVRLVAWEQRRKSIIEPLRAAADQTVDAVLAQYADASRKVDKQGRKNKLAS